MHTTLPALVADVAALESRLTHAPTEFDSSDDYRTLYEALARAKGDANAGYLVRAHQDLAERFSWHMLHAGDQLMALQQQAWYLERCDRYLVPCGDNSDDGIPGVPCWA